MIKVVEKAFKLLEFVAAHDGKPILPSDAASALDLNQATTVRIFKDLLALGYLTQISRNKGYVPGPMTKSVFMRGGYAEKLMSVAAPVVTQCADRTGESAILAVMQNARRYLLLHENRNPRLALEVSALYYEDIFATATGRVLLAYAEPSEVDRIVGRVGLPDGKTWAIASTHAKLTKSLRSIRRMGYAAFHRADTDLFVTACPIFARDICIAALGVSFPNGAASEQKCRAVLTAVRESAVNVSKAMRMIRSIG